MQKILLDFTIQTDWRIKLHYNVTGYHQCGQEDKSVLANQHCCAWDDNLTKKEFGKINNYADVRLEGERI